MQRAGELHTSLPFPKSTVITITMSSFLEKPLVFGASHIQTVPLFIIIQSNNLGIDKDSK